STSANHRVTAVLIAQDAIERMELNPAARDTYLNDSWTAGTLGDSPSNTCITGTCDSEAIAAWDIAQLTWQAANQLPAGRIEAAECRFDYITCVAVSCDIQVPDACVSGWINSDCDCYCFVLDVAR